MHRHTNDFVRSVTCEGESGGFGVDFHCSPQSLLGTICHAAGREGHNAAIKTQHTHREGPEELGGGEGQEELGEGRERGRKS